MKMLEKLPEDVQRLIISLPYRVGCFISASDQSGGDSADVAEQNALRNIVTFYVEDTVKSEFAHEIMYETLKLKPKWEDWKANIENVPSECQQLNMLLRGVIDAKEIISFKQNLLEIAVVVAQAYRETNENAPPLEKFKAFLKDIMRSLHSILGTESLAVDEGMLSVSHLERIAIMRLADDLSIEFKF